MGYFKDIENFDLFADPCLEMLLQGHRQGITQVCFNPEGNKVATSSLDSSVIVWDLTQTDRCIRFAVHNDCVYGVSWSQNSNKVASCSKDKTVKIWEPKIRGESGKILTHNMPVRSVDFNSSGSIVVSCSDEKPLVSAKFSPDGKLIASCGCHRFLRVYDADNGDCVRCLAEVKVKGRQLAWHPGGCIFAVASSCNRIKIFDLVADELIQLYEVHSGPVNDLAFHPSGLFLLSCSDDETIKIFDVLNQRPIYTLKGHNGPVKAVAFNNDGSKFATAGDDKQLLIWKSNLDKYESALHSVKLNLNDSESETHQLVINDLSILIDPCKSMAYRNPDENLQVIDSEYSTQLDCGTPAN